MCREVCPSHTWPKPMVPMACAVLASLAASSGKVVAEQYGRFPGLLQVESGLRSFAMVALSRACWDLMPAWQRKSSTDELSEESRADSGGHQAETLEREPTEALFPAEELPPAEALFQAEELSPAEALHLKLSGSEEETQLEESDLKQEVYLPKLSCPKAAAEEASSLDENGLKDLGTEALGWVQTQMNPLPLEEDLTRPEECGHCSQESAAVDLEKKMLRVRRTCSDEPKAKRARLTSKNSRCSPCGVHIIVHGSRTTPAF